MENTVLFVPRQEMIDQAMAVLKDKDYAIKDMRVIFTKDTAHETKKAIAEGAELFIARGRQAALIKQCTDIPVAEIRMTAQEMGLLVKEAREMLGKQHPIIGIVGYKNMFCDMSMFDRLYDVDIRMYYAKADDELEIMAQKAITDGVDLVIGGDTVVEMAKRSDFPALFLAPTEDSMRNAFSLAEHIDYAMKAEKRTEARFEALLDNSFNGVIRTDSEGRIGLANHVMEDMLGSDEAELRGQHVLEIFPDIDPEIFSEVMDCKRENYSFFIHLKNDSLLAVMAPIIVEGKAEGVIINCNRLQYRSVSPISAVGGGKKELDIRGALSAGARTEDFCQHSQCMQECVKKIKLYAMSERAVLITGEPGTETRLIAECIHNLSGRKEGRFGVYSCTGSDSTQQTKALFSSDGLIQNLDKGTLLIEDADEMTRDNQRRLFEFIKHRRILWNEESIQNVSDVRIIFSSEKDLKESFDRSEVIPDIYYLLSGFGIAVPPLRERKEDLKEIFERFIKRYSQRYGRYHILTEGAVKALLSRQWNGNLLQADSVCEYLILNAKRRSIDEIDVNEALRSMYHKANAHTSSLVYRPEDAEALKKREIIAALNASGGRRAAAARMLGISKSTLWRCMKKYEIR